MTAPADSSRRREPRITLPFRVAPSGKAAIQRAAKDAGYEHYTEWIRDLCAAEIRNPKHHLRPKPPGE